jgi:hypothetical protein
MSSVKVISCSFDLSEVGGCAACGVEGMKMRCGRCKVTKYCSLGCQKSHWGDHKMDCANLAMRESLQAMGTSDRAVTLQKERNMQKREVKENRQRLREIKKAGRYAGHFSGTAFGVVGMGRPIPDGVPANFHLKQAATSGLKDCRPGNSQSRGNLKGERAYKEYYDDLQANSTEWMVFFAHEDHYEHAEHTCGILGTLATIYRQRGQVEDCEMVLDKELEVLGHYQRSVTSLGLPREHISCCDGLTYKYNVIRFNLYMQTKRYEHCVQLIRELVTYEAKYGYSRHESNFLFLLPTLLQKEPTLANARGLSDGEVKKIIMLGAQSSGDLPADLQDGDLPVRLQICAQCGQQEGAIGEHKKCQGCRTVFYCGRACQKKDWKRHKKICKPSFSKK